MILCFEDNKCGSFSTCLVRVIRCSINVAIPISAKNDNPVTKRNRKFVSIQSRKNLSYAHDVWERVEVSFPNIINIHFLIKITIG